MAHSRKVIEDNVAAATEFAASRDAPKPDAPAWFASRHWQAFAFQREVWAAMAAGESGLLHASTGSGKTYAVCFGALQRAAAVGVPLAARHAPPPGVLWRTPMRALAADTTRVMPSLMAELAPACLDPRLGGPSLEHRDAVATGLLGLVE